MKGNTSGVELRPVRVGEEWRLIAASFNIFLYSPSALAFERHARLQGLAAFVDGQHSRPDEVAGHGQGGVAVMSVLEARGCSAAIPWIPSRGQPGRFDQRGLKPAVGAVLEIVAVAAGPARDFKVVVSSCSTRWRCSGSGSAVDRHLSRPRSAGSPMAGMVINPFHVLRQSDSANNSWTKNFAVVRRSPANCGSSE